MALLSVAAAHVARVVELPELEDWVLAARCVAPSGGAEGGIGSAAEGSSGTGALVAAGLSHNAVELWSVDYSGDGEPTSTRLHRVQCAELCILYGLSFYGDSVNELTVAAGTVFNVVLLWRAFGSGEVAQRLSGHGGVVFRTTWSDDGTSLLSVSDDRTVRLWSARGDDEAAAATHDFSLAAPYREKWAAFGHRARVWSAAFAADCIVTASEDSSVFLWSYDGEKIGAQRGHIGKHVWRVAVDTERGIVASGGGDGSVRLWDLNVAAAMNMPGAAGHTLVVRLPDPSRGAPHGGSPAPKRARGKQGRSSAARVDAAAEEDAASDKWRRGEIIHDMALLGCGNRVVVASNLGAVWSVDIDRTPARALQLLRVPLDSSSPHSRTTLCVVQASIQSVLGHCLLALGASDGSVILTECAIDEASESPSVEPAAIRWPAHSRRVLRFCIVDVQPTSGDSAPGAGLAHIGSLDIVTGGADQMIRWWRWTGGVEVPQLLAEVQLCGARVTPECICVSKEKALMFVGTSAGQVVIYDIRSVLAVDSTTASGVLPIPPSIIIRRLHGREMVRSIWLRGNDLFTAGHNGHVTRLRLVIELEAGWTGEVAATWNRELTQDAELPCPVVHNAQDPIGLTGTRASFRSAKRLRTKKMKRKKAAEAEAGSDDDEAAGGAGAGEGGDTSGVVSSAPPIPPAAPARKVGAIRVDARRLGDLSGVERIWWRDATSPQLRVVGQSGETSDSGDGPLFAMGFYGTEVAFCDVDRGFEYARLPCGGWRRPFDFCVGGKVEEGFVFAFSEPRDDRQTLRVLRCPRSALRGEQRVALALCHGRVVTCGRILSARPGDGVPALQLVTGAESSDVRTFDAYGPTAGGPLQLRQILDGHILSVRSIAVSRAPVAPGESPWSLARFAQPPRLLAAGGTRDAVVAWRPDSSNSTRMQWVGSYMQDATDQDQRINALVAFPLCTCTCGCEEQSCGRFHVVIAADSEGTMLVHLVDLGAGGGSGGKLHCRVVLHGRWRRNTKPVLSLAHTTVPVPAAPCGSRVCAASNTHTCGIRCGVDVLFSGATDGSLCVWDMSATIGELRSFAVQVASRGSGIEPRPMPEPAALHVFPTAHQCGTNAVSAVCLSANEGSVQLLAASGGDDQALSVAWLELVGAGGGDAVSVGRASMSTLPDVASAALTAVSTDGQRVFCCGADQRLDMFDIELTGGGGTAAAAREIGVSLRCSTVTEVADVSSIDVIQAGPEREYCVFVAGEGAQVLHLRG